MSANPTFYDCSYRGYEALHWFRRNKTRAGPARAITRPGKKDDSTGSKPMKKLIQTAVFLIAIPTVSLAQNIPGFSDWANGFVNTWADLLGGAWHSSVATMICQGGQYYLVTYRVYDSGPLAGTQIPIQSTATGMPCDCEKGGGSARPAAVTSISSVHPDETNCSSDNGMGQQVTVPGQEAAGSTSGWGGPSSFSSPPPLARQAATGQVSSRASPAPTFTFTVPFRDLPAGPLLTEVTSPVPWACNSSVNPTVFRVLHVDNVVKRYNSCTLATIATIPVPTFPLQVRVTPDGARAIVTSFSGAITFINTATNAVSGSITVPSDPNFAPSGIAIAPDGSYALVSNYPATTNTAYSYLSVVDIAGMKITSKIPLAVEGPESVFINPDGTLARAVHPWDNAIEVVDILTGAIVEVLKVTEPFSIVFNPTGTRAFVSSGAGSIEVVDTKTYQVIKTVPADAGALDLQITPDGTYVYANNSLAQSITVIDAQSLNATTTPIGGMPQGSALVASQ